MRAEAVGVEAQVARVEMCDQVQPGRASIRHGEGRGGAMVRVHAV
jgi:hypothetical protein